MIEIAFGTWKLTLEETPDIIQKAIEAGYTHMDTAASYANEAAVGEGVGQSAVPREQLFISGKLWNTKRAFHMVHKACVRSLSNLNTKYFDQYLVHWPFSSAVHDDWQVRNSETWRAMETLAAEGIARHIGVCNFTVRQLRGLMDSATRAPEINQIEMHPGYYPAETLAFCRENHIRVEAWSPLGNGQLTDNPLLQTVAHTHSCSVAQVCLAWCLTHGVTPITKTSHTDRMRENLRAAQITLTEAEMDTIDNMEQCSWSGLDPERVTQFG